MNQDREQKILKWAYDNIYVRNRMIDLVPFDEWAVDIATLSASSYFTKRYDEVHAEDRPRALVAYEAEAGTLLTDSGYWSDYSPIYHDFGDVLLDVSSGGYQGDTYVLLKGEQGYGYICFGWGSCSGCDALQACNTWGDVQELYDRFKASVEWRATAEEMLTYFSGRDWEGQYSWHDGEFQQFVHDVKELLKARVLL